MTVIEIALGIGVLIAAVMTYGAFYIARHSIGFRIQAEENAPKFRMGYWR